MADLALGYSKTALDFVVNKVQTAIKEEEEQWLTVQRDLEFITGEFEMMQSFLNTADGERLKSLVVRTWVQQVRNLSYDVEDSIEFVLQLDFNKRPWWLRLLPSWMKKAPEAPVDEAVAEITQLKARVMDVSNRNMRYHLVTDSGDKPGAFRVLSGSHLITNDVRILQKCLKMHDDSLRVICVVSETIGDPGTLHFIRRVYKQPAHRDPCRRAWVKLMHPFNPHEFIRSLLAQILMSSCDAKGKEVLGVELLKMEENKLMDEFVQQVKEYTYFIVLEGVASTQEWHSIKTYFPDRMNGSRLIVWTHHVEIATQCTGVPYRTFVVGDSSPDHRSFIFYREDSDEAARDMFILEDEESPYPFGLEHQGNELLEMVTNTDRRCRSIVVWGSPGVEKTALVRAVYDRVQRLDGSAAGGFKQQAWADVPDPFHTDELARIILSELTKNTWKRSGDLVTTCKFVLEQRRTLLVLDGVRSKHDWDRINADITCATQPESCAVVITEDVNVTKSFTGGPDAILEVHPYLIAPDFVLHGRLVETDELLEKVREKNCRRVAVWGPPGVGKTALVRDVFDRVQRLAESVDSKEKQVCESAGGVNVPAVGESDNVDDRFRQQAWANVPDPFVDVAGVARDIISGMTKNGRNRRNNDLDDVTACRKLLADSSGRTLVVLDGVRSKADWELISVEVASAMQPGSCVVVVTEDESVAAHVGRSKMDRVLRVNPLGAATALGLMEAAHPDLYHDAGKKCRSLSSKCGGLPKFIVTTFITNRNLKEGGINIEERIRRMELLNENFLHQLQNKPQFDCLKRWLAWLHSKFDGSPALLKKCIFYMSLFPQDGKIRRKRLARRWIAEGYCRGTNSNEEADNLIDKIRDLCLFQPWETVIPIPSAMSKTSCEVNHSFLDYIISRQTEEKTFLPLDISVLDGRCSPSTNCIGQHLAIRKDWVPDKAAYISMEFSRLRSLTASGEWKPFFIPQKMRVLRVLDLEDTSNLEDDHLDEIGELMPRLKFLSLRCRPISRLPESLGKLLLLETLDIRDTEVTVLPETITKLQKLQHIRAGKTHWCSSGPDVQEPAAAPTPANCAETPSEPSQPDTQSWGSTLSACLCKSFGRASFPCLCKSGSDDGRTGGVGVPRGMGAMKALQTLGVVDIDMPGGKALLAELSKMKKKEVERKNKNKKKGVESHPLRNLSLCGLDWSCYLLHCISSQDQLESLTLRAMKLEVEHFNLPPNIVKFRLHVDGTLQKGVVDAIKDHGKLETLRLRSKKVEGDTVSFFDSTKAGESDGGKAGESDGGKAGKSDGGKAGESDGGKAGESDAGSFREVKILEISCSSSVRVMFSQQGMKKLEVLKVHCHSRSRSEISGLEISGPEISGLDQLGALKQVWLAGLCDNTLKEALESQIPKPKIYMEEQGSS